MGQDFARFGAHPSGEQSPVEPDASGVGVVVDSFAGSIRVEFDHEAAFTPLGQLPFFPSAHFVKAFNSVGNAQMVNPHFAGGRPTMFICGNDAGAKRVVTQILDQFGWDTEDMGAVEAARAIEPLCMLWCIPGVGKGDWSPHAFKLLR